MRYELPDYMRETYKAFGIDLEATNGDDSWTLPLPARYIIDRQGVIRYARVNADYTRRPQPMVVDLANSVGSHHAAAWQAASLMASRSLMEALHRCVERTLSALQKEEPGLVVEGAYYQPQNPSSGRPYDIAPDGQRFLMITEGADDQYLGLNRFHVVLNWFEELKRLVSTGN